MSVNNLKINGEPTDGWLASETCSNPAAYWCLEIGDIADEHGTIIDLHLTADKQGDWAAVAYAETAGGLRRLASNKRHMAATSDKAIESVFESLQRMSPRLFAKRAGSVR